jgi:endoglucanase
MSKETIANRGVEKESSMYLSADLQLTVNNLKMPKETIANRLFVEIHFYDPYDFCLEGKNVYLWGKEFVGDPHVSNWSQEDWVIQAFGMLKTAFVNKGIPVINGEYCVTYHGKLPPSEMQRHLRARDHSLNHTTKMALTNGVAPVYWDNGVVEDTGSALFDRKAKKPVFNDAIEAITGVKFPGNDYQPSDAPTLAKKLGVGWNLGNALESCNGTR